jgi:hypothetical protein
MADLIWLLAITKKLVTQALEVSQLVRRIQFVMRIFFIYVEPHRTIS